MLALLVLILAVTGTHAGFIFGIAEALPCPFVPDNIMQNMLQLGRTDKCLVLGTGDGTEYFMVCSFFMFGFVFIVSLYFLSLSFLVFALSFSFSLSLSLSLSEPIYMVSYIQCNVICSFFVCI